MSYDEQPDGDIHGECSAEIHRLQREIESMESFLSEIRVSMTAIVDSDWRTWQDLASPEEFEQWVKRRANHMMHKCDAMLAIGRGEL